MKWQKFIGPNATMLLVAVAILGTLILPSRLFVACVVGLACGYLLFCRSRSALIAAFLGLFIGVAHFLRFDALPISEMCLDSTMPFTGAIASFPKSYEHPERPLAVMFDLDLTELSSTACGAVKRVKAAYYPKGALLGLRLGDVIEGDIAFRPLDTRWSHGGIPANALSLAEGLDAYATVTHVARTSTARNDMTALRRWLSTHVADHAISEATRRLLQGLLLGRQDALEQEDWRRLRQLGIVHVMVVSGLHVSLVALWVSWLLSLPRRCFNVANDRGSTVLQSVLVLTASACYVALTGASLPALRSLFMVGLAVTVKSLFWRSDPLATVVLSATTLIMMNPWSALTTSFWLSVLLTGLIVAETDRASSSVVLTWVRLNGVVSIASIALTVIFFGQFSLLSLVSNGLFVPVFTVLLLPLGLLSLVISMISPDWGGVAIHEMSRLMEAGLSGLGALEKLNTVEWLRSFHVHPAAVFVALLTTLSFYLQRLTGILMCLLLMCSIKGASSVDTSVTLWVSDIGQGTLAVVKSRAFVLAYDTGGVRASGRATAEKTVIPWLRASGIQRIDLLIVSHGDLDHAGGLDAFKRNFEVMEHWGFGGEPCVGGRVLKATPELSLELLSGTGQDRQNTNDDSCVVAVDARGQLLLFMGDVSADIERDLIAYGRLRHGIKILLAAHHGSLTSSGHTFVDKIDAEHAIFTTRRGNAFDHPKQAVVSRFLANGATLWDTAADGGIQFIVYPNSALRYRSLRSEWSPYWTQLD